MANFMLDCRRAWSFDSVSIISSTKEFSAGILYISGIQNTVADAFYRIDEIGTPSEIDYEEITRAQAGDVELLCLQDTNSNFVSKTISLAPHGTQLHCDVPTGNNRSYFRSTIINAIHLLAHSCAKATANAVKQRVIWTSLRKRLHEILQTVQSLPTVQCQL
ncbi:hypothetical protein AVEN_120108-1 [Araneus ventricosus]|uniref:Uncharacterized protein n=1 Tax=Araneus ventricosus TaxID=182803 RepID=A0A4Y2G2U2_ARAVE|nr:hypothetical protein AVEN_120108-1 [Araneus ventricosus]